EPGLGGDARRGRAALHGPEVGFVFQDIGRSDRGRAKSLPGRILEPARKASQVVLVAGQRFGGASVTDHQNEQHRQQANQTCNSLFWLPAISGDISARSGGSSDPSIVVVQAT